MSVNSNLSSIGVILRVSSWIQVLHNVVWAVAVRRCCQLLMPEFSLDNDAAKLCARKERLRRYFNRGKRILSPVNASETIRVRSPTRRGNRLNASEKLLHDRTRF